ncbi:MAG TPA: DAHL domain-containing protein [Polyangiaceae bacterium]|nr:DAHL domain-containing protein [Polyangiaceae bacterium]
MTGKRLLLRSALIATMLAAVALAVVSSLHRIDHGAEASYRRDLRRLEALDAQLDREVLRSRSGLVMHYDSLTQAYRELRELEASLAEPPAALGFDPRRAMRTSLDRIGVLLDDVEVLLDNFKAENAVLRNSRRYFPVLLNDLHGKVAANARAEALSRPLSAVLAALAYFDVAPAKEAVARLAAGLDDLDRVAGAAAALGLANDVALVTNHGRTIAQRWPVVDQLVAKLLDVPLAGEIGLVNASYEASYRAALYSGQLRLVLFAALGALAIVLGLAELYAKRQSGGRASDATDGTTAEERERERERRAQQLDASFVTAASRELRAPIAAIRSSNQLLSSFAEGWDSARRGAHFERIDAAARQLGRVLDEVQLIRGAELGALAAAPSATNLEELCAGVLAERSRASTPARSIHFSYQGERHVELDRRLFVHALDNVIENALKYSEAASPVGLHVAVHPQGVHCIVEDAGIGIDGDDLPRLFDSFHRGRNVGAIAGSGLGLAAARCAVKLCGGTIEVTTRRGSGTQVAIWLPLDRAASEPSAAAPTSAGWAANAAPKVGGTRPARSEDDAELRWMWHQRPAGAERDEARHTNETVRHDRAEPERW